MLGDSDWPDPACWYILLFMCENQNTHNVHDGKAFTAP